MSRFTDAVAAELVKVRTVRGLVVGAVLATLALPLTSLLVVTSGGLGEQDTLTSGAATGTVVGLLAFGAWGASVAGSEYVHRTITVSLAAVPHRPTLLLAKLAAAGAIAAVGGAAAALLSVLLVHSAAPPHTHHLGNPWSLVGIVLAFVAVTVVGVAVGVLVRSSTASIAVVAAAVLLPKAAAGLLGGLQPWVVGASPGTVVTQLVHGGQLADDQTFPGGTALALLSMLAVATAVGSVSALAFGRRDG
ncbi:hypothetical protein [Nocardioides marmorisolisilvae]|uniref:ABC transporter permease n=1 Tax=Nocardioides marmorisolisilvae TaxID=1542737 RepID=A0A3N0DPI8_9ACTN|nr:hypothetical protein [Nocardioides marmorisolisilvae]RNL77545.1 hypothetical protein EFL95_16145 [Nocardioides marmorisolisilvae]